ncbi:MAG: virulence protein RhuM/Fic/DOC family protein [Parcubacteria group bacterium]|jgi:prophage maintenance system killer protein
MQNKKEQKEVIIYQSKDGAIELRGDFKHENIWASQAQIAQAFGVDVRTVNEHIKNIYKTEELQEKATIRNFRIVQNEGGRQVKREVNHYNLDMIISVGYRISSKTATKFRKWATKTIREHIVKGYTINKKQIAKNYEAFMQTVASIQNLLPEHVTLDPKLVLELIKEFASTWVALDAYDKEVLRAIGTTKKAIKLSGKELVEAINELRAELIKKGEASDLFAREKRAGSVEGIVGNVMQSFGGKNLYPSAEEKAAHLLYFMVKNHPFDDGNKRSGAFAFVWFLRKTKIQGMKNINPSALTALTLLIAESNPKKMNQMTALVTTLLSAKK